MSGLSTVFLLVAVVCSIMFWVGIVFLLFKKTRPKAMKMILYGVGGAIASAFIAFLIDPTPVATEKAKQEEDIKAELDKAKKETEAASRYYPPSVLARMGGWVPHPANRMTRGKFPS